MFSFCSVFLTKYPGPVSTCDCIYINSYTLLLLFFNFRNGDNVKSLSYEVAMQNRMRTMSRIQNSILGNNVSRAKQPDHGIDHLQLLESWSHDCGHNSTKAPILWAHDNMADKLAEDTG